jgi:hypothetical protein
VDFEVEIGRALQRMRLEPRDEAGHPAPGLSLDALATRMNLKPRTLRAWEDLGKPELRRASKRNPTPANIEAWARACGYSVSIRATSGPADELSALGPSFLVAPPAARRVAALALEACAHADAALVLELEERLRVWVARAHEGRAGRPG